MAKKSNSCKHKYYKTQLLESRRYRKYKDILSSILNEDISYSFDEVDELIDKFMKGTVI